MHARPAALEPRCDVAMLADVKALRKTLRAQQIACKVPMSASIDLKSYGLVCRWHARLAAGEARRNGGSIGGSVGLQRNTVSAQRA